MDNIRVNVFPGMANPPIIAAMEQGFFAQEGIAVEFQPTPSSLAQRAALIDGTADLAHAAFDDVIAGVEDAGADFAAVWGGDGGFQALYAHPGVRNPADLKGTVVAVDDPDTAYALVLRAVLRRAGVHEDAYEMRPVGSTARRFDAIGTDDSIRASMLAPPFSIMAEDRGWRRLGSVVDLLGAYQGTVAFCRRAWLAQNTGLLVRYHRGYMAGLAWVMAPENRAMLTRIVARSLNVSETIAGRACAHAIGAPGGLDPRAAFDREGMRQVIAMRADILKSWGGQTPDCDRYIAEFAPQP